MPLGTATGMAVPSAIAPKPTRVPAGAIFRLARRLQAHSFTLAPEQLAVTEGLRAAVVVASLVTAAVWSDQPTLSWAAFGAFWSCLADPGGPDRRRLACMGAFMLTGAACAFVASAASARGMAPAAVTLFGVAFLTGLGGIYGPAGAQVGTLAAVVAVVAVAFPQPPSAALALSAAFLLGSAGALVLCVGIWRIHPHAAVRRALGAIYRRLEGMLSSMPECGGTAMAGWRRTNAEHCRDVRSAIERARGVILDLESGGARYHGELDTVDAIFASLIAMGHTIGVQGAARSADDGHLRQSLRRLLAEARRQTALSVPRPSMLALQATTLADAAGAAGTPIGPAVAAAARALADQANAWLDCPDGAAVKSSTPAPRMLPPITGAIVRHAARIAVAVVVSYGVSAALGLRFSYWATMATVVVLQPFAPAAWPRCVERMLGSIAGGLLAVLLLGVAPGKATLLIAIFPVATATIALRRVNYTLFVIGVTCLFVLVAELLQPSAGIAAARIVDNVLGSIIGAAAGLLLWPERAANDPAAAVAAALEANIALVVDALRGPRTGGFHAARRAAGIASTNAETTCHRLALVGQSRRLHLPRAMAVLAELRDAAAAATARVSEGLPPDAPRAAAVANGLAPFAAAVRDTAAPVPTPPSPATSSDAIDAAIHRVTDAVEAYIAALQPSRNPVT